MADWEIKIKGRLTDSAAVELEESGPSIQPVHTTLRGPIRDRAELHGLIDYLRLLGCELLEARPLDST